MNVKPINNSHYKTNKTTTFQGISGNGITNNLSGLLDKAANIEMAAKIKNTEITNKIQALYNQYYGMSKRGSQRKLRETILDQIRVTIEQLNIVKTQYDTLSAIFMGATEKSPLPMSFKRGKGFDRIGGYDDIKLQLNSKFFGLIADEKAGKKVNIPNAFIFFGPYGNGKSTFANAVAEQMTLSSNTKCRFIDARENLDDFDKFNPKCILENVLKIARNAKDNFNKNGRTIIYIDEFTEGFNSDPIAIKELSDFMATCSDKYKCTMFLNTNHMSKNGLDLEKINPVYISVDMPNKINTMQVLSYYLKGNNLEAQDIDYEYLATALENFAHSKGIRFNNTNLRNIARGATKDFSEPVSAEDIIKFVNGNRLDARENPYRDEFVSQACLNEFAQDFAKYIK